MEASPYPVPRSPEPWKLPKVSLLADREPFDVIAMNLAADCDVSVTMPPGLGSELVSLSLLDVEGEYAFRQLASAVNLSADYKDGVVSFYRGKGSAGQRVVQVVPVGFEDREELLSALRTSLGESTDVQAVGDRLVVVSGADGPRAVGKLMGELGTGPDGWMLEVRVVQVSDSLKEELGIAWNVSGGAVGELNAAAKLGTALRKPAAGVTVAAKVEALLRATSVGTQARLLTTGNLFLLEGKSAELHQGDSVPVIRRSTSDSGTVTDLGYELIKTGFTLKVSGKRVPQGLLLNIRPSLSSVTGFVKEVPIVAERTVEGWLVVRSGDWVMLSGLDASDWTRATTGVPGKLGGLMGGAETIDEQHRNVVVIVRAVRVFASAGAAQ
jgi:type II secretory pathway component GspD/PulD (secretin)